MPATRTHTDDVDPYERYTIRSDNTQIPKLVEEGPQYLEHGIGRPTKMRVPAIRKLHVRPGRSVSVGNIKAVWYLDDLHSPEEVVLAFLRENDGMLEQLTKHTGTTMFNNHSTAMADAWRSIADTYGVDHPHGGDGTGGGTDKPCPFCDDDIPDLPSHISDCSEAPTS